MRRSCVTAISLLVVVAPLAACGGSDSDDGSSNAPAEALVEESGGDSTMDTMVLNGEAIPACDALIGDPVEEVANYFNEGGMCGADIGLDDLEPSALGLGNRECTDGTFLYWNDSGWGSTGGIWSEGSLPPDSVLVECEGSVTDTLDTTSSELAEGAIAYSDVCAAAYDAGLGNAASRPRDSWVQGCASECALPENSQSCVALASQLGIGPVD